MKCAPTPVRGDQPYLIADLRTKQKKHKQRTQKPAGPRLLDPILEQKQQNGEKGDNR